ncbi:DRTGG domain-containing protein [Petroclostridium xylanilyticum]|uniref:DRTGG domain-containing protein n=1 Tax=Petroclostridium xylanilyticum TaxID=1792311 RepID=UPI00311A0847
MMTVKELVHQFNLKIVAGGEDMEKEVQGCYICDLLSWVMTHAQKGNIWITVQTNVNIIAVAVLTEVACIIIPEDIEIDAQTIAKANQQNIPVLSSSLNSFQLASILKDFI